MKIIVDTCIWSLALRRDENTHALIVEELKKLIFDQKVQMIGPVRQELLSGIKSQKQFKTLKSCLSAFPDLTINTEDHELAAEFYNINRKKGIQGSNTDFLICALSYHNQMSIFTNDMDFKKFSRNIPVTLHKI